MSNDLISRQAVIDALIAGEPYGIEYNINKIRELPPAQAEIVRCKDCKWWFKDSNYDGLYRCANDGLLRKEDHYCADVERREE